MKRILVVDDYSDLSTVMSILLKKHGYSVDVCCTSDEVFSKIYSFQPDLIILDVFMDNESGKTICTKIKQMNSLQHIPVLLYSGQHFPQEYLYGCGYNDFIQKPFHCDELLVKINVLINKAPQTI